MIGPSTTRALGAASKASFYRTTTTGERVANFLSSNGIYPNYLITSGFGRHVLTHRRDKVVDRPTFQAAYPLLRSASGVVGKARMPLDKLNVELQKTTGNVDVRAQFILSTAFSWKQFSFALLNGNVPQWRAKNQTDESLTTFAYNLNNFIVDSTNMPPDGEGLRFSILQDSLADDIKKFRQYASAYRHFENAHSLQDLDEVNFDKLSAVQNILSNCMKIEATPDAHNARLLYHVGDIRKKFISSLERPWIDSISFGATLAAGSVNRPVSSVGMMLLMQANPTLSVIILKDDQNQLINQGIRDSDEALFLINKANYQSAIKRASHRDASSEQALEILKDQAVVLQ